MEVYYVAWVWLICVPTRGCFTCRLPDEGSNMSYTFRTWSCFLMSLIVLAVGTWGGSRGLTQLPPVDHQQDFLNAIRSRNRTICHGDIGARTAVCCHLLKIAYRYRQSLKWDAANNTLVPGHGDPVCLSRRYRHGYELNS